MPCTKQQEALIRAAFNTIPELPHGFSNGRDLLYGKSLEGEKQHRRNSPSPKSFPATLAARYFTVKLLREYAMGERTVTVADYLRVREDHFYAAALASEHFNVLWAWALAVDPAFAALDYAELMK